MRAYQDRDGLEGSRRPGGGAVWECTVRVADFIGCGVGTRGVAAGAYGSACVAAARPQHAE